MIRKIKPSDSYTGEDVKEFRTSWLSALRSDKYKQARRVLRRGDKKGNTSYCCFGVFCHLFPGAGQDNRTLSPLGLSALGMSQEDMHKAIDMNDDLGYSFSEIADHFAAKWRLHV